MSTMPTVNDLVRMELRDGIHMPSRVENVDGDRYAVATPSYVGDLERPEAGTEVMMLWTSPRGLYGVRAVFEHVERDRVSVWWLRVVGEIEVQQRRRFVRAPFIG